MSPTEERISLDQEVGSRQCKWSSPGLSTGAEMALHWEPSEPADAAASQVSNQSAPRDLAQAMLEDASQQPSRASNRNAGHLD